MTEYATLKPGDKLDYELDWATWLGTDTVTTSTWAVSPVTGLTLSADTHTTTTTTVWGEVVEAGTYRLTNAIVTAAGRESSDDVVIYVAAADVAAYLTPGDAEARLWGRYRIEAEISVGDVEAASDELDNFAPFVSSRYSTDTTVQTRQFPRSTTLDGDTENEVPERILDWVALCAYQLATDEGPAVTSEGAGGVSVSYANPKVSQTEKRMAGLLSPYLQRVGVRA